MKAFFCLILAFASSAYATCGDALSFPEILCHDFPDPPDVAVCIYGTARTFAQYVVYRSLRDNVLNAFGTSTTLFADLTVEDARYDHRKEGFVQTSSKAVHDALTWLHVPPEQFNIHEKLESPLTANCSSYAPASSGQFESFLHQVYSRYACHNLITEFETKRSKNFTWVLFARPDLVWVKPVFPWCTMANQVFSTGVRNDIISYLLNRADAFEFGNGLLRYLGCEAPFLHDEIMESWMGRYRAVETNHFRDSTKIDNLPSIITRNALWYKDGASPAGSYGCNSWLSLDMDGTQCRKMLELNSCNLHEP
jgi:hypothetical protein